MVLFFYLLSGGASVLLSGFAGHQVTDVHAHFLVLPSVLRADLRVGVELVVVITFFFLAVLADQRHAGARFFPLVIPQVQVLALVAREHLVKRTDSTFSSLSPSFLCYLSYSLTGPMRQVKTKTYELCFSSL